MITKKEGYVVKKEDKFWGVQYADGQCTSMGYGPIERVEIHDTFDKKYGPAYYTSQNGPYIRELMAGRVVKVTVTKQYTFEELEE